MEGKYVVTYRPERGESIEAKVMFGSELAKLYGMSDCSGACEFHVWEVNGNGQLDKCRLEEVGRAQYNHFLGILNEETMSVDSMIGLSIRRWKL